MNIIGNGVVVDPVILMDEIRQIEATGVDTTHKLKISRRAQLILPTHRMLDAASEASKGKSKIGSTLKGIGPAYMDKTGRNGLRFGDVLCDDFIERYNALKAKHMGMLSLYPGFEFNLDEYEANGCRPSGTSSVSPSLTASSRLTDTLTMVRQSWRKGRKGRSWT